MSDDQKQPLEQSDGSKRLSSPANEAYLDYYLEVWSRIRSFRGHRRPCSVSTPISMLEATVKLLFKCAATFCICLMFTQLAQASIFDLNCSADDGTYADFVLDTNNKTVSVDIPDFQVWTLLWNDQHISWVMSLEPSTENFVTVISYLLERESGVLIATALLASDDTEVRGGAFEYLCRRPI